MLSQHKLRNLGDDPKMRGAIEGAEIQQIISLSSSSLKNVAFKSRRSDILASFSRTHTWNFFLPRQFLLRLLKRL